MAWGVQGMTRCVEVPWIGPGRKFVSCNPAKTLGFSSVSWKPHQGPIKPHEFAQNGSVKRLAQACKIEHPVSLELARECAKLAMGVSPLR
jgi:hypothetical protein